MKWIPDGFHKSDVLFQESAKQRGDLEADAEQFCNKIFITQTIKATEGMKKERRTGKKKSGDVPSIK